MKNRKTRLCNASVSLAIAASLASASLAVQADDTGLLTVSAQVAPVCEIVTTAPVAFGTLDPNIDNDAAGSITWRCTNGTSTEVILDGGVAGGDGSAREMRDSGSNVLPYQLYTTAGRTSAWLNTPGAGVSVTGNGYGSNSALSVYGRVLQADSAAAVNASYEDTVTVTILF